MHWRQRVWRSWRKPILVFLVGLLILRSSLLDLNRVPSTSMMPSLLPGDRVLVNRLAYGVRVPFTRCWLLTWGQPTRGEVVVFDAPVAERLFVKRVIGLPGDTVAVRNGQVWINGIAADEGSPDALLFRRTGIDQPFGPITVPAESYFVLGDNRNQSKDSRWFGFVERPRILGRVDLVLFSLDPANHFCPRWRRILAWL